MAGNIKPVEEDNKRPMTPALSFELKPRFDSDIKYKYIPRNKKFYMCDLCSATLSRLNNVEHHLVCHIHKTGKDLWQNEKISELYRQHFDPIERLFKCELCSESYKIYRQLKQHLSIHLQNPIKGKLCSAVFKTISVSAKKIHSRTQGSEKQFKCEVCLAAFSHAHSLKKHARTHTGEKPFRCKLCSAAFTRAGDLKRHARIHSDEKSYTY